jgi:hypothetical protein
MSTARWHAPSIRHLQGTEELMASPDTNTSQPNAGGDASQRSSGVMNRVRESASAQLSTQKNKATDGIGSVAQAVRQSTQQLRDQQHETIAEYVESAANQIEQFSQRLRDKNVGDLVEDAQRLARKQPAVFIGSAFALGLLGVRFFKSSARRDREYGQNERFRSYAGDAYPRGSSSPYGAQSFGSTGYSAGSTTGYSVGSTEVTGGDDYTGGEAEGIEEPDTASAPSSTRTAGMTGRSAASASSGRKPRGSTETERS